MVAESLIIAELGSWIQKIHDSRIDSRIAIVCAPHDAPRIRAVVEKANAGGVVTVYANEHVPHGQAYTVRHPGPLPFTIGDATTWLE